MQRKEGSGTTTAARIKALLLHVQRTHGRAEADAFLLKTRLDREYLDDETRPIPLERWHAALVAFASRWGREGILGISNAVVDRETIGVWTRVLRGTSSAEDAFAQLDAHGSDDALPERWETQEVRLGYWRGRLPLAHDPAYERDGLCGLARAAELAAVPMLFGWPRGNVKLLSMDLESENRAAEFEVRWREAASWPTLAGAALAGAVVPLGVWPATQAATLSAAGAIVGAALGALGGHGVVLETRRRASSRAQHIRIQALERLATLREARERSEMGYRPGAVVAGQYRLGEQLGVGASGAIFEATRLTDGGVVAVKLLRTPVAHDTVAADRLRREAAALGLAWHPNVVEVYDDGHLPDGTSYLVMERLFGEPLGRCLAKRGALPPAEVKRIALEICDALEAVHAAGVIHRDLKPSNIFLCRTGPGLTDSAEPPHVKVLDFGVARIEWAETRITNMGTPLGTPGYMSPEQEQGLEIDVRSDLFALGGVIYECLSGAPPPLSGSDRWQVPATEQPSGVQRTQRLIQPGWKALVDRAMAPNPADRFHDARGFREALQGNELELEVADLVSEPEAASAVHAASADQEPTASPQGTNSKLR